MKKIYNHTSDNTYAGRRDDNDIGRSVGVKDRHCSDRVKVLAANIKI